jgi:DNA-binding PadR family transcriptional regulator
MPKPASPIRGAILGLIAERPTYTYDLGVRLAHRLGLGWDLRSPNVYSVMDTLEKEGLVHGERPLDAIRGRQQRRAPTVRYHITPLGEEWLSKWMRQPIDLEPSRTPLLARLAVARPEDVPHLLVQLDTYEKLLLSKIRELNESQEHEFDRRADEVFGGLCRGIMRSHNERHLRAELEWVGDSREHLGWYARGGG